ncbi:MAG: outer membrane protein assembly factor BamC [Pseudomonadota bacterium]|nr:outer membrane protein assembly factor BamC [Pseudomonadota bacterium]MEC9299600.1 outer membrane protein assembly factor BamC [Pseudomonadota bacterium]
MFKLILIIIPGLVLSSCNYLMGDEGMFRDRGGAYLEAQAVSQMEIPETLDSYTLDQLYVIPEQIVTIAAPFEGIPMPKPIETRRREGVIIQSLATNRWILIDATPGQVWPLVRDYWTELQIILDFENPSNGIMETAWVEVDNDQEKRHKYRVAIEPGLHSGYSEIYIVHMENLRTEPIPLVLNWPQYSDSEDLEREIMSSISQYLADRNDIYQASTASLLAGSIEAESKANIVENESGKQVLELKIDYDRAWVQIREALETAEILIVDSNRDENFFNVRFSGLTEEGNDPGFIRRIFGGDDEDTEVEEQDFSVRLLENDDVINVITEALETSGETNQLTVELLQVINDNLT